MRSRFLKRLAAICLFMLTLFATKVMAQEYSMDSDVGMTGEELWVACGFCHGAEGQGGPALDAPPLAGMEAWYVEKQLKSFQNRWRGMHPEDVPGLQMSIVSGMARNEATIKNISAYIEAMDPNPGPEMVNGQIASSDRAFLWISEYADLTHPEPANAQNGQNIYESTCLICHGSNAQGNPSFGSPKLTSLPDWYIHRQLQYFRDGIRGAHKDDVVAATMVPFAKMLASNQAIADVTAYIDSL